MYCTTWVRDSSLQSHCPKSLLTLQSHMGEGPELSSHPSIALLTCWPKSLLSSSSTSPLHRISSSPPCVGAHSPPRRQQRLTSLIKLFCSSSIPPPSITTLHRNSICPPLRRRSLSPAPLPCLLAGTWAPLGRRQRGGSSDRLLSISVGVTTLKRKILLVLSGVTSSKDISVVTAEDRMASAIAGAVFSVVGKALAPLADPVLQAWAASKDLGPNVEALKDELLCVKAVLEDLGTDREIRNAALEEMLRKLQDLAYDAEDALDELDYFRIQDHLHGTLEAIIDNHPKGCAHNLLHNARHTAKAVGKRIWLPSCKSAANTPAARPRAREDANHGDGGEVNGCVSKLTSAPRCSIRAVGKCLPCSSLPPVHDDEDDNDDHSDDEHEKEITKLEFDRVDVSKRIEHILQQLQPMCQKICMILGTLGLDSNHQSSAAQSRPHTISESIERKLYGRDPIMKSIIHDITCGKYSDEDLTVLPIVGPGGIGKTALAQYIYHSPQVQKRFDVKVWVCVSLNFNVDKLTEEIEKFIPRVDSENKGTAAELIGQRLKSKRFFLVLDDLWECSNEDEWARLLLPFRKSQKKGNIIIVTTRRPALAQTVTKPNHSIELGGLAFEDFKDLFLSFVFNAEQSRKDHPDLLEIGDKIMEKLKGSPLAAKTVGRLLRHHLDYFHWTRVLESQEWKEQKGENDIMPALKLSYDHLPFYLKPCFHYCALFPQDYKFGREELVHLWIGINVLHSPGENKRIEDIGLSHLAELVDHGFFKKEEEYGQTYFVIHDLLHELALKVSSRECLSIYSSNVGSIQVLPSVRHLSVNIDDTSCQDRMTFNTCMMHLSTLGKDKGLKVENLHSLMLFGRYHGNFVKTLCDLFREAKALRVIFVSEASYNVEDLLPNLLKFIHLRYLRIDQSDWFSKIRLPNNISILYQLRVLDIQRCKIDNVLPRDITNLIKLRHLLVPENELHSDIFEVGRLKWLQQLRRFVVEKENQGFELRQIGDLVELCGSLQIDNLEMINVKEEAHAAKLSQKTRLHKLQLHWDIHRHTKDSKQEEHVLECLKPSSNLRELCVKGHGGYACPSWLGLELSVQNLGSLCLNNVAWKIFPPIGGDLWLTNEHGEELLCNTFGKTFQNLRSLELINLPTLRKWVADTPCHLFAHLEVLIIRDCSELTELSFSHSTCCQQQKEAKINRFPKNLRELKIEDCPKLMSFPPVPWTRAPCSAKIQGVGSGLEKLVYEEDYKSEYSLEIKMKGALVSELWNVLAFDNLTELKELKMDTCPPLPLHHFQMLSSLKTLRLSGGSSIIFPSVEGESHVEYQSPVKCITISRWDASARELTQLLTYFPKLSVLGVLSCEKITGLGVVEKQAIATPTPASPDNRVDDNVEIEEHHQQQDGTGAEEERGVSSAEGLLLLPSQLQKLWIWDCPELSLQSSPVDHNREAGQTDGGQGLQSLRSLRSLDIDNCPRFLSSYSSSSSSSCPPFPTSLKRLYLNGALGTATSLPLSNLASLTDLTIERCGDLRVKGLRHLLAQGCLTELTVRGTPNLAGPESPLPLEQESPSSPSKLQRLFWTNDVAGVLAPPICTLLSSLLTELSFWGDKEVERFTKEQEDALQLLTSLKEIRFEFCDKLQCLPAGLHALPSLKRLSISSCQTIQSLPKDGLPSSLQELVIDNCPAIWSLPKDCLPSSLQKLVIMFCPAIRSLPKVNDLPSSLRELDVRYSGSEELRRQCRKLIGIIPVVYA